MEWITEIVCDINRLDDIKTGLIENNIRIMYVTEGSRFGYICIQGRLSDIGTARQIINKIDKQHNK
jgi:hypothetical protein